MLIGCSLDNVLNGGEKRKWKATEKGRRGLLSVLSAATILSWYQQRSHCSLKADKIEAELRTQVKQILLRDEYIWEN